MRRFINRSPFTLRSISNYGRTIYAANDNNEGVHIYAHSSSEPSSVEAKHKLVKTIQVPEHYSLYCMLAPRTYIILCIVDTSKVQVRVLLFETHENGPKTEASSLHPPPPYS